MSALYQDADSDQPRRPSGSPIFLPKRAANASRRLFRVCLQYTNYLGILTKQRGSRDLRGFVKFFTNFDCETAAKLRWSTAYLPRTSWPSKFYRIEGQWLRGGAVWAVSSARWAF